MWKTSQRKCSHHWSPKHTSENTVSCDSEGGECQTQRGVTLSAHTMIVMWCNDVMFTGSNSASESAEKKDRSSRQAPVDSDREGTGLSKIPNKQEENSAAIGGIIVEFEGECHPLAIIIIPYNSTVFCVLVIYSTLHAINDNTNMWYSVSWTNYWTINTAEKIMPEKDIIASATSDS